MACCLSFSKVSFLASVFPCAFFSDSSLSSRSYSSNASSSVGFSMSPPPLSLASLVSFAFNFQLMVLKQSLTARLFTMKFGKLLSLLAMFCQAVPLSLLLGLLSNTPKPATSLSITLSFASDQTITDLMRHDNKNA